MRGIKGEGHLHLYLGIKVRGKRWAWLMGDCRPPASSPMIFGISWSYFLEVGLPEPHQGMGWDSNRELCIGKEKRHRRWI